jgi:hypothetical protein
VQSIFSFILIVMWVFGIIIAKGFWSTSIAVIIPLWSWYLVVEHLVVKYGLM